MHRCQLISLSNKYPSIEGRRVKISARRRACIRCTRIFSHAHVLQACWLAICHFLWILPAHKLHACRACACRLCMHSARKRKNINLSENFIFRFHFWVSISNKRVTASIFTAKTKLNFLMTIFYLILLGWANTAITKILRQKFYRPSRPYQFICSQRETQENFEDI